MCIICFLHSCHISLTDCLVIHYRFRVIFTNYNSTLLLYRQRSIPRFVNVLRWKIFELWQPLSNVFSVFVCFLSKRNRTVAPEILVKMRSAGQPLLIIEKRTMLIIINSIIQFQLNDRQKLILLTRPASKGANRIEVLYSSILPAN